MLIYLEDADTGGPDTSAYIEVPDFELSDAQEVMRGQTTRKGVYGNVTVTDRGYTERAVAGLIQGLTCEQMYDLEDFVSDTLKQSLYRFYLRRENKRKSETWNRNDIKWKCGATISGTTIKCGQTLDGSTLVCGQRIPADYEWIGPLRLNGNGLKRTEVINGDFTVSISANREKL